MRTEGAAKPTCNSHTAASKMWGAMRELLRA